MEKYYSAKEVAQILSVTKQTVINLINRGELAAVRVASVYRIKESDLKDYLERNKQ